VFRARYKLYLPHLKGSRTLLVLALLFGVVYASTNAIGLPFLVGKVLPTVFGDEVQRAAPLLVLPHWLGGTSYYLPKDYAVAFAVAFLPAIFILRGVAEFSSSYFLNLAGLRVVESVRRTVFEKLQRMHLGFFGKISVGDLLQRVINDANSVRLVLVDISNDILIQPLTMLFALGYVVWLCLSKPNGVLFLACLVVVPVAVFSVRAIGRAIQKRARSGLTFASDLNSIAVENLQAARDVRAYGLQERESSRFAKSSHEGLRMQAKLVRYEKVLSPLIEISAACGIAIAIGVGASVGFKFEELLSLITAFYMAYGPIKKIGFVSNRLHMAEPGLVRLEEIVNAPIEVADLPNARSLGRVKGEIVMKDLSFAYGKETVLSHVTIAIKAGQSVALVGPSGAGKSTFVNLVPRFFDPQQGSLWVDGVDIREVKQADLRANIALVSQEPILFNETIAENIRIGKPSATDAEIREAAQLAGALDFINSQPQGFNTMVGERGGKLSGGQRQRIAIARAFLKDAPILILDEATSALDTETERSIQNSLSRLMSGRTTLIVAHRFSTIRDVDRILVFDGGRIVADGTRDEIYKTSELFRRLWDNQSQGLT
jgi:subfamily B ATP-binding cassette protein MsbA